MIEYYASPPPANAKFSIIIPSWNNLPYLKTCIQSIRTHSQYEHEVAVHVNDGSDGTVAWLIEQQISFTHSPTNIGICIAMNAAYSLTTCDYIVYMNDDMYVCPQWDRPLWDEIAEINHPFFYLSATLIEPTDTGNPCVAAPYNFGTCLDSFQEKALVEQANQIPFDDWVGTTWPPNVMHRKLWDLVGGFSLEFSPGMYSDPDFAMKAWQVGVRHFKGVGQSKIYHFQSKSTLRVKKNNGKLQFLRKWGLSASTFTKYYLHRGEPFKTLTAPTDGTGGGAYKARLLKDRLKRYFINKDFPTNS